MGSTLFGSTCMPLHVEVCPGQGPLNQFRAPCGFHIRVWVWREAEDVGRREETAGDSRTRLNIESGESNNVPEAQPRV